MNDKCIEAIETVNQTSAEAVETITNKANETLESISNTNERVTALETPAFTQATSRTNIASGNTIPTILGKIMKYFTDLKSHAFNSLANNLTTTTTGYALDATQGKALNDKFGKVLWKNPNPTAAITTLDITLDSDDYDILDVYWKWSTDSTALNMNSTLKGFGFWILATNITDSGVCRMSRDIIRKSDVSFTIKEIESGIYNSTSQYYTSSNLIPYKIIGRKLS